MQEIVIPFQIVIGTLRPQGYPLRALCGERTAEATMPPPVLTASPAEMGVELGNMLLQAPIRSLLIEAAREAIEQGARMQIQ
ncbi:MAG: polysaccharide deacetylase, partial [Chloroflexi bacterium]